MAASSGGYTRSKQPESRRVCSLSPPFHRLSLLFCSPNFCILTKNIPVHPKLRPVRPHVRQRTATLELGRFANGDVWRCTSKTVRKQRPISRLSFSFLFFHCYVCLFSQSFQKIITIGVVPVNAINTTLGCSNSTKRISSRCSHD